MAEDGYKRILLKLSGEALLGGEDYGIDPAIIHRIATEISDVSQLGIQIAVVIGGGNIFRGAGLAQSGIDRVTGDHMGMLATVMNALAMRDALERSSIATQVMSAIPMHDVCEDYIRRRAVRHLEKGRVVICAGGTGNPFFTTDTAAALRAIEIGADIVLKATKVDGVYSADPQKVPDAKRYERLSYADVLKQELRIMDGAAIALARDNGIPIIVFSIKNQGGKNQGSLALELQGQGASTTIDGG